MSDSLHAAAFPASRDPTIAPHLLHPHPLPLGLQHIIHSYDNTTSESPGNMYDSESPPSDDPPSPISGPITSSGGMLVIHSYGPGSGRPGDSLTAQVDFRNIVRTAVHLRVVFGDRPLVTHFQHNARSPTFGQGHGDFTLRSIVPDIDDISAHMAEVRQDGYLEWPLTLVALDGEGSGAVLDSIRFGLFTYDESSPSSSPSEIYGSRSLNKRFREDDDYDYSPPTPIKRLTLDTEAMRLRRMSVASAEHFSVGSQHRPTANRVVFDGPSPAPSHTLPPGLSIRSHAHQHNLQLQTTPHPQHVPPEALVVQSTPEEYPDGGPALVRTTQLVARGEQVAGAKAAQASVAIQGDLNTMKYEWSDAERMAGRRLVQFWRQQVKTTLHIFFKDIPQHQYTDEQIVVSCIYREEIDEFFITSVDVMRLLESLAVSRFEVEEKNRIRRNLEVFKPKTISKSKPGTEEFFRVMMEFAAPKPRNIEKDVKVFEWGNLKMMLEKVFSKYSTVSPTASSPSFEGSAAGSPGNLHYGPSSKSEARSRGPRSRSYETRKKRSPVPAPTPPDVHHVQLPTSSNSGGVYPEPFVPVKYSDGIPYDTALEHGGYTYSGLPYYPNPPRSDLDSGFFKGDSASSGGITNSIVNEDGPQTVALPAIVPGIGRPLNGFRSPSPPSSDNSPTNISLCLKNSPGGDGGLADWQDIDGVSMGNTQHSAPRPHL